MRRHTTTSEKSRGQSIVEMALVLPILLLVVFGIIEFGWLIFAYSTISQAARNGAEVAAQLPPYDEWLQTRTMSAAQIVARYGANPVYPGYRNDRCVDAVLTAVESDVTMFGQPTDADRMTDYVQIRYPASGGGNTRNLDDRGPIEIAISYPVRGITPLFSLLRLGGDQGVVTMTVVQRRSLESLGRDPTSPTYIACASDPQSYYEINEPPTP